MPDTFDMKILLTPEKAYLRQDTAKSLEPDAGLTRYWEVVSLAAMQACRAELLSRRMELNPMANQRTFPGTHRVQNVTFTFDAKKETGVIYEQLALGLITQIAELAEGYDSTEPTDRDMDVRLG